jgi:hypothetical protein
VASNAFFDGQSRLHRVLQRANAGKRGNGVHSQIGFQQRR